MMQCPKCSHERQEGDIICPACGVLYDKYNPARVAELQAIRARLGRAPMPAVVPAVQPTPPPPQAVKIADNVAVCTRCGEIGDVKIRNPFNLFIFALMFVCGFVPGVAYWIWCRKQKQQVCGTCASEKLVAARTPAGREIIADQYQDAIINEAKWIQTVREPAFGRVTGIFLVFLSLAVSNLGIVN